MVETQKYWFAARTLSKQEFAVKKRIENLNLEEGIDVECYLPTRTVISQLKYRRKRNVVPVARGLILFMPPNSLLVTYIMFMVSRFLYEGFSTHSMLVVPDKQMQDFMFVMDLNPEGVCFDNEPLTVGKRLQLSKGSLAALKVKSPQKPTKLMLLSALRVF